MMSLDPREWFTIARGLEDHTITTTFYVRAVVRNARTDELIDTVDLTDSGDHHRYSKAWQVPADSSGLGFYILVTTSVYTDAAYTTKSSQYGDKYDTYLVQDRVNAMHGGGGAGSDVDYKRIQKMIDEAILRVPVPEKPEKVVIPPSPDLKPVLEAILSARDAILGGFPEQKAVDLSPILAKLDMAIAAAKDKAMTREQMAPLSALKDEISAVLASGEETVAKIDDALEKIRKFFTADVDEIKASVGELAQKVDEKTAYIVMKKDMPDEKKPDEQVDEIDEEDDDL